MFNNEMDSKESPLYPRIHQPDGIVSLWHITEGTVSDVLRYYDNHLLLDKKDQGADSDTILVLGQTYRVVKCHDPIRKPIGWEDPCCRDCYRSLWACFDFHLEGT